MNDPIDRNNRDDLLKQFGRVEIEIRELDKIRSRFDKELDMIPRKIKHLKNRKEKVSEKISRKQLYLNQLKNDIDNVA